MLKILHTSDWHLGHQLYGYDRSNEQKEMLGQMVDIVREEIPDLFLLCGDVFHTSQPSAATTKMFVSAITEIKNVNPDMCMVILAGNHDSGTRHEVFKELWSRFGVHTIGILHENKSEHIIKVRDKGYVIAVPYIHHRLLPPSYFQELLNEVEKINSQSLPVVMAAHTTIKNSSFRGHDDATEYNVGGIDCVDIMEFGEGYDYFALGHIHQPQFPVKGNTKVRYSGTPLAVSFDENQEHHVSIIEIGSHKSEISIWERSITDPKPLITFPKEGYVDWETAKELLYNIPADEECYVRVNVSVDDALPPGINDEARNIVRNKKCSFCLVNTIKNEKRKEKGRATFSVKEFKEENPFELFKRFIEDTGRDIEDYRDLFQEVLLEIGIKDH